MQYLILLCFTAYTLSMLPHVKYRNSKFTRIEKKDITSRRPKLKENGSEYILLQKICNDLFYFVLEYIHQRSMLSHVKYRNSNFT